MRIPLQSASYRNRIALALAALALSGAAVFGQTISGDITGAVLDQTGAAIPNATVTAKNVATGVESVTKSTGSGDYHLSNLPAGSYDLTATATGFSSTTVKGVAVELNRVGTTNITMQVGTTSTTVEVSEATPAIDTTSAQISNTFESIQAADLPISSSGSGVINLSLLTAGVSTSGASGLGTGPSVGGQRPRNNNFTIEGIDNNSGSVTGPLVNVPGDAVAEFTLIQNQFTADFGHSSGGQFNQTVKSGTNSFHGEAFLYNQNRNYNAADTLSATNGTPLHPRFDSNRFGGNFGGPIKKNKLFFFGDYEYNPTGSVGSAGLLYGPTAAGWNTLAGISGISSTNLSILKQYLGTAPSPSGAGAFGGTYPLVGPGLEANNEGPGSTAAKPVAWTGVPVEMGQLSVIAPSFTNSEFGVGSIDYTISANDALRGRFILNRSGFIDTAAALPAFYTTVPSNNYLATISEFHNFSPTIVNEFRLGYNRYSQNYPAGNFKYPGLDQFPNVEIFELGAQLGPDPNAPQFGIQNLYQLADNVSWTRGKHTFKFGFDGWKQISPQSFTQRSRGDYDYNYLSDFLFDQYPDYLGERSVGNVTYYGDRYLLAFYGQDAWKIRPNFTINIGLRYEYNTVPYSETLQTVNAISSVPGLITFGKPTADKTDFMPRIGLAYSPGTDGKTSIRAGFGINYDVLYDNQGILSLPPQFTSTVDVGGNDPQPTVRNAGFLAGGGIPPSANAGTLSQADARAATGGFVPNQQRPKSLQWNLDYQRVLKDNYTVDVFYLGTRGIHLPVQARIDETSVVTPQNALPLYYTAPSQATLNGLTNTLSALTTAYNKGGDLAAPYLNAGFQNFITAYEPWGNSNYNGLGATVNRRMSNGLQFLGSYTFSHNIDDSTADVFSTYLTPRRPSDITQLRNDRSSSALDHRQRLSFQMIYEAKPFKDSQHWMVKNIIGNWEFAPIYVYQSGTLYTIQSGVDANLNGDSAGDRVFFNPSGQQNAGTGTTALKNSAGQTVAFLANNPNAQYVVAPKGTLPNLGRNTGQLNPIDDIDLTIAKRFNITERTSFEFSARVFNVLNHPQFVAGYLNEVAPIGFTGTTEHNFTIPNNGLFNQPQEVFSSNPRGMILVAKFKF